MSVRERPTNVARPSTVHKDKGGGGDEDEDDPEPKNCDGCRKKGKGLSSLFRRRKGNKRKKQKGGNLVNSGVCLCLKQPLTLDSSSVVGESPTSDPNSPAFGFSMLRSLIEKNDFYSKECNPHLDS